MANESRLDNDVRTFRERLGWSQDELARLTGLSRAGISAIETGRLVPSTSAALALARAFDCVVEDIFRLPRVETETGAEESAWALPMPQSQMSCRYWRAEVAGLARAYPVEVSPLGLVPHDGMFHDGAFHDHARTTPAQTLVIACCDPAVSLLAEELARAAEIRLIVLQRSSHAALDLLGRGLIHAAGVHLALANDPEGNSAIVRNLLAEGTAYRLLRVADWDEGIAIKPGSRLGTIQSVVSAKLRWVSREAGSGAQQCLAEVLGHDSRVNRSRGVKLAFDHRGVADAIRGGWADAGICLRLTSQEANLDFLSVRREAYDLCFPASLEGDPRLQALLRVVRSSTYRRLLSELPGYTTTHTGVMNRIDPRGTKRKRSSSSSV